MFFEVDDTDNPVGEAWPLNIYFERRSPYCIKLKLKIVHEHVFDMQLFKKSEIGWVEK